MRQRNWNGNVMRVIKQIIDIAFPYLQLVNNRTEDERLRSCPRLAAFTASDSYLIGVFACVFFLEKQRWSRTRRSVCWISVNSVTIRFDRIILMMVNSQSIELLSDPNICNEIIIKCLKSSLLISHTTLKIMLSFVFNVLFTVCVVTSFL